MAFVKPTVKTITADISNLSIYLRSQKKFGKSTLARDVVIEKYGDPSKGMLVEIGHEHGDSLMDNVNSTHVDTYKDFVEMKKWLISEKGKEHDIKIIFFDVVDEMVAIFEDEVVRMSNLENPQKKCKSILSAYGGFNAGVEMAAKMIKEYISDLRKAGFGVWAIAHTKLKSIKEKGSLEEDSYVQLTSNLKSAYESAFGDVMDLVLTGYIDRNLETRGEGDKAKHYSTEEVRKLYFRGNSIVDAGSRFSADAVPEYMIFDKDNMAPEFIKIIEDGIEKSKSNKSMSKIPTPTVDSDPIESVPTEQAPEPVDFLDDLDEDSTSDNTSDYPADIKSAFQELYKSCSDATLKKEIRDAIKATGMKVADLPDDTLKEFYDRLK